ncbi:hypothetical protein [Sphingobacterium sp. LRF_L2]|uniref:hypothetical protein n=1 Tax=Sphingobacterium sp. LRF_L2 TaxID=3369421 RepID=UPI003F5E1955
MFTINQNGTVYSVPTVEEVSVKGVLVKTNPELGEYVCVPNDQVIVVYRDNQYLDIHGNRLNWFDDVEKLFREHAQK